MDNQRLERPALPEGYYYPDKAEAEQLLSELHKELPQGHVLYGVLVQPCAARYGTDDTLFQHCNEPTRYTFVHLTWSGKTEINAAHPTVEFDGTFAAFLATEQA